MKARTRIAIACQGGGSQTAFTAGALKALCEAEAEVREAFEVVSISGTSGGAVCAALLWYSYMKGEHPLWERLINFWHENTAHGWAEEAFNDWVINLIRMINSGMLPAFQISPSSPMMQMMMQFAGTIYRKDFLDFPTLLRKYIDFDEVASWGARASRPVLMVGASNVSSGKMVKFVSTHEPIRIEHILASCAVPTIFAPVRIGDDVFWDGLFSDNPPVEELVRPRSVGIDNIPEEIWLIKINPTARKLPPMELDDILDRRNQLEGNISLFHQLGYVETINDLILFGAFRPEFLAQLDIRSPIRIPKSFSADPDKPYHIPCIEMSAEIQAKLDYEGKLDRGARNIDYLIAEGERSALRFLKERAAILDAESPRRANA
ncbi:MAG TPA: patatin-like phospholipase family protein [Acetobacteraceae bacterium]|nr:patatin-like phospholipase family protein [Acetobacteraceae bacterium]